jgi:5'-3' exonuclease
MRFSQKKLNQNLDEAMNTEKTNFAKTLLLVDGSSFLYRAFHAMPDLRNRDLRRAQHAAQTAQ